MGCHVATAISTTSAPAQLEHRDGHHVRPPSMRMCPPTYFHRLHQIQGFFVSCGPMRKQLSKPLFQIVVARWCALLASC